MPNENLILTDRAKTYIENIKSSGLSIYDPIVIGDENLWIPSPDLELILDTGLRGTSLAGLPIRTRSKIVKEHVCRLLGYPVPKSFLKSQPRFPGQNFDTYVQKSNNLQVWNEELSPTRRYVLIRVSEDDVITKVKVITGDVLAELDTTGTLTQKYQARCIVGDKATELVSLNDTELLRPFVSQKPDLSAVTAPINYPVEKEILSIEAMYPMLAALVGTKFQDAGHDQERNRGAALHRIVCKTLGYSTYQDDGQFPDVRHQLLEIKLQTSPTIDLGLVLPNSIDPLDIPHIQGQQMRHCDVRYAVFCGKIEDKQVVLINLFLTTGEAFFTRFTQFQGKVLNKKLQIPLPSGFFERKTERVPDQAVDSGD
jgi:hypothetical protein